LRDRAIVVSVDPRLEGSILAELALRERRERKQPVSKEQPRAIATRVHRDRDDLLAHLRRVADAVPNHFRSVAWLHHAFEAGVTPRALTAAGLTLAEVRAIELLALADPAAPEDVELGRIRAIAEASGTAGCLARVVGHAALEDRLGSKPLTGESLTALRLLTDPRLAP
jgi:hypothetical protein